MKWNTLFKGREVELEYLLTGEKMKRPLYLFMELSQA